MSKPYTITVITAHVECPFCPTTYVGRTASGQTIYARYRWGALSVRIDPRDPAPFGGAWGLILMEGQYGDPDDGHMTYDELRERSENVVSWPDDLSPRPPDEANEAD